MCMLLFDYLAKDIWYCLFQSFITIFPLLCPILYSSYPCMHLLYIYTGTTAISTSDNTHYQEEMFSPVKIETVFELNYLNDKVREINGDSDDDSEGERGYHRRRDRIFE